MKIRHELTLADCEKIAAASVAEARRNYWFVAIAILDDGGHLLHFVRMDGATPASAAISVEKARTAALSHRSSGTWEERVKQGRTSMLKMPGILPVQGGVPIIVESSCVGAVGVSGVQSHEDEQIAQVGIDALLRE
jgi:uncharacterized protein GlcG (DUF336 family)